MALTVSARARREIDPIKGSRFIATAGPVTSEEEARSFVGELRVEMPDATHHCAAWRIASPSIDRAVDDGEPSGSAGRPILSQLSGRELVNVIVVVTRYYGGTKLGVGGLGRAYGSAAGAVLDELDAVPHVARESLTLHYGYPDATAIDRVLAERSIDGGAATYTDAVERTVDVPVDGMETLKQALLDAAAGRVSFT